MHCGKERRYSITSSAAVNNLSGMVSPSALPPKGDIAEHRRHVRFVPKADIVNIGDHQLRRSWSA
jgi:hypothetical protein